MSAALFVKGSLPEASRSWISAIFESIAIGLVSKGEKGKVDFRRGCDYFSMRWGTVQK